MVTCLTLGNDTRGQGVKTLTRREGVRISLTSWLMGAFYLLVPKFHLVYWGLWQFDFALGREGGRLKIDAIYNKQYFTHISLLHVCTK